MDDLFREFWWLSFPASFMLLGAFRAWLDHRARQDLMQTLRKLAADGRDPPTTLLAQLRR